MLLGSLAKWKKEGYTAVWLKLPVSLSHLIPVAVDVSKFHKYFIKFLQYLVVGIRISSCEKRTSMSFYLA